MVSLCIVVIVKRCLLRDAACCWSAPRIWVVLSPFDAPQVVMRLFRLIRSSVSVSNPLGLESGYLPNKTICFEIWSEVS